MRILVVEDEKDLREVIIKTLKLAYYSVDGCDNGIDAKHYIESTTYDAVLLDVMMPGMDGFSVLKKIREANNKTPVIILSAKDQIEDRVNGLDLGADDYLVKPFSFDELLARLRVVIRRKADRVTNQLSIADLVMDLDKHEVRRRNQLIELSSKEFAVLEYMMHSQGIVLSRNQIEEHVWDYDYEGASNVVDVYIRYLRKKIDQDYGVKLIHTVRGAGYVLKVNP